MRFQALLQQLEARLDLPYPERALVLEELEGELEGAYAALREQGLSEADADRGARRALELDEQALTSLASVHLPAVRRVLDKLPPPAREWLESLATALPLALAVFLIAVEVPVVLFLKEGGPTMYTILLVGALALLLELQRAAVWFVLRDHSPAALRKNTATPLYLATAVVLMAFMGAALDYYVVLSLWAQGEIPEHALYVGLREPLPCIIVGMGLSTLIVLLHGALQVGLRALRIPEVKSPA